ncbi:MAG: Cap15 family cyclic dinucleotide receptor domain-containing protein [Micavibrio sp.]
MWSLVPKALQVLIVVALGVIGTSSIAAVTEILSGKTPHAFHYISIVATVITIVLIPFVESVWRHIWLAIPAFNRMIFPDLNGTWEGELVSTWKNPETGLSPPPIPVTFWISQGVFSMSVRMKTGESRSYSTRCLAEADRKARIFRLWYGYDNRPDAGVSHRSARHEGAAWLELDMGSHPDQLIGQYFTQRNTTGDIRIRQVSRHEEPQ